MVVVIPFHQADAGLVRNLLKWIAELGPCNYPALLVADAGTNWADCSELLDLTKQCFASADLITNEAPVSGWTAGSNSLFMTAARHMAERKDSWLLLEPDCIPLKAGWLDILAGQYQQLGAKYMACVYQNSTPGFPPKMHSGIAIYPPDPQLANYIEGHNENFDIVLSRHYPVPVTHTNLIQHVWGEKNLPPTFAESKTEHSTVNTFTLANFKPEAVLFHRQKDGSLIRLLRRKLFPDSPEAAVNPLSVVLPVHNGDIGLALHHAKWLNKMQRVWEHEAVISYDATCNPQFLQQFEASLRQCFKVVRMLRYTTPPNMRYPAAANWAWRQTAIEMFNGKSPWFWCEADGVVLRPDWLFCLQAEYYRAAKSWMGVVVPHMGHLQGTSVYPADAAARMPRAMACPEHQAFDMEGKLDTEHDRHDASHLLFHVWSMINGNPHPVGGGEIPARITPDQLRRWLPKSAVYIHRIKDTSGVDALLSGQLLH